MEKNKIVENGFSWTTPSKLPGSGPIVEEPTPWLWLCRQDSDLYLVNSSGENIDEISADSGGMQTIDDKGVSLESSACYLYKNIKPHQAVKVDEYDDYYDLDSLIQVYITLRSEVLGHIQIRTPLSKGGIDRNTALIWTKDKLGKHVQAETIGT